MGGGSGGGTGGELTSGQKKGRRAENKYNKRNTSRRDRKINKDFI